MLDSEEMDKLIALLDKIEQKEFKKLFTALQKADEQEKVIRDFITQHFDAVISEREKFILPSGEEIIDAITVELSINVQSKNTQNLKQPYRPYLLSASSTAEVRAG